MKMKYLILLLLVATALSLVDGKRVTQYTVENIPDPQGVVSDPDGILNDYNYNALSDKIQTVTETVKVPVQMTVAIISKMNIPSDADEEDHAEDFARKLHDKWGVGTISDLGSTGVLIFLSVDDRVVYISRGSAMDALLRNARIDKVIASTRPFLKQAKYGEGLLSAVESLADFIEQGEPTWKELVMDWFSLEMLVLYGYFGCIVWAADKTRRAKEEQRIYAEAASQLSTIDRAQAEALQGHFQASSCPICLENFVSDKIGSDEKPIRLLRCGHVFDETCWQEWVSSGQGNIDKCPICKRDVGVEQPLVVDNDSHRPIDISAGEDTGVETPDRAIQIFQQERNFRLMRLAARYPRYITPSQVQRWSSPTYNRSLVRDQSFTQNRPADPVTRTHRSGGSSSHFGGGSSSGGRGGRF
jgi:uncharacterized membrane protein YgcG